MVVMMTISLKKAQIFFALLPFTCIVIDQALAQLGVNPGVAFFVFALAGLFGLVDAGLGLFYIFKRQLVPAVAMGFGIIPLLFLMGMSYMGGSHPVINDIVTDPENPILFMKAQDLVPG